MQFLPRDIARDESTWRIRIQRRWPGQYPPLATVGPFPWTRACRGTVCIFGILFKLAKTEKDIYSVYFVELWATYLLIISMLNWMVRNSAFFLSVLSLCFLININESNTIK
jgi:hypothetical protein